MIDNSIKWYKLINHIYKHDNGLLFQPVWASHMIYWQNEVIYISTLNTILYYSIVKLSLIKKKKKMHTFS